MEYICTNSPKRKNISDELFNSIRVKIENNIPVTDEEINIFLSYEVDKCRSSLSEYLNVDIETDSLTNRCDLAQRIVGMTLGRVNNVLVYPKETQNVIDPNVQGHSFSVCVINEKEYLIDLTFRQFFDKEKCVDDAFFIMDDKVLLAPMPGYFLNMSDENFAMSGKIIEDGFIRLDEKVAKTYCDSFYYTKQGKREYSNIPGSVYLKSLVYPNFEYVQDDKTFEENYGSIRVK